MNPVNSPARSRHVRSTTRRTSSRISTNCQIIPPAIGDAGTSRGFDRAAGSFPAKQGFDVARAFLPIESWHGAGERNCTRPGSLSLDAGTDVWFRMAGNQATNHG